MTAVDEHAIGADDPGILEAAFLHALEHPGLVVFTVGTCLRRRADEFSRDTRASMIRRIGTAVAGLDDTDRDYRQEWERTRAALEDAQAVAADQRWERFVEPGPHALPCGVWSDDTADPTTCCGNDETGEVAS